VAKEHASMSSNEDNREITVKAPLKPAISPEKQAEKAVEKALEEERFEVLQFPKKISRYFGITVAFTGGLLLFLVIYMGATGQTGGILLSAASSWPSLAGWGFVGLLNIVVGFLFLGRE
jgi:hypothetical protein